MGSYLKIYAKDKKDGRYIEILSLRTSSSEVYEEIRDCMPIANKYKFGGDGVISSGDYTILDEYAINDCLADLSGRITCVKHELSVFYKVGTVDPHEIIQSECLLESLLILKGQFEMLLSIAKDTEFSEIEGLYCNI